MKRTIWASVTVGLAALMTFGCGNVFDSSNGTTGSIQNTQVQPNGQGAGNPFKIWAVDTNGALFSFFSDNPGAITVKTAITGTSANEKIVAIDCRPRTGVLYGMGVSGKIYWIDKATAVATLVGNGVNPAQINADIDFNPVVDRIRQEADAQNLQIAPSTGTLFQADTNLTIQPGGTPANAVACAYSNPDESPSSTQLFVITGASNRVYLQATPPNGQLTEVGQLPLDIGSNVGFDIAPGNIGFASVSPLNNPTTSTLLRFDPSSGAATIESTIGGGIPVKSIAVDLAGPSLVRFVGIDANKNLVRFNSNDPTTLISSTVITGTTGTIVGCDFSPGGTSASGLKVLAVPTGGGLGKVYTVDLATAAATEISTTTAAMPDPATSVFGIDILPSGSMIANAAAGTFTGRRILSGQSTKQFVINPFSGATTSLPNFSGYIPAVASDRSFVGGGLPFGFGVNLLNTGSELDVPGLQFVSVDDNGVQGAQGFMNQVTTEICELDMEPNGNMWFVGPRVDLRTGADPLPVENFSTLFRIGRPAFGATPVARVGGAPIKSFAIIPALNGTLTAAP